MPEQPHTQQPPNAWLGVLGVALVLGFAGLAISGHASSPTPAQADSSAAVSPSPQVSPPARPPTLYADEGGAHDATQPKPDAPAPAVGLFE